MNFRFKAIVSLLSVLCACKTEYIQHDSGLNDTPGQPVREISPSRAGIARGTGPESQDVLSLADKMLRSILAAPAIANAPHPPTIVLLPLTNKTRFMIESDIFTKKLRAELNTKATGRAIFLGRERMPAIQAERELKREEGFTSDPALHQKGPAGADYFLSGDMTGLSKNSTSGAEDYILYTFQLIDAESSAIVWEDEWEMKRVGQDDVVYR